MSYVLPPSLSPSLPIHKVWKMLKVIKDEDEDLLNGEVPIQLDEESFRMSYQIITDPKFPGQFRVVRREGRAGGREGNELFTIS